MVPVAVALACTSNRGPTERSLFINSRWSGIYRQSFGNRLCRWNRTLGLSDVVVPPSGGGPRSIPCRPDRGRLPTSDTRRWRWGSAGMGSNDRGNRGLTKPSTRVDSTGGPHRLGGTSNMTNDETEPITHDVAFDLLSSKRRRFVLSRLQDAPGGMELSDLATELSSFENEVPPEELSSKDRKRVYVSLYQTHVPKLDDTGLVAYDSDTGTVRPTEQLDELAAYFEPTEPTVCWGPLYGLVALVGLGLYALAVSTDAAMIAPVHVGVGVLVVILALSLGQYIGATLLDSREPSIPAETDGVQHPG